MLTTDAMKNVKKSLGHWNEIYNAVLFAEGEQDEESKKTRLVKHKFVDFRGIIEEVSKKADK